MKRTALITVRIAASASKQQGNLLDVVFMLSLLHEMKPVALRRLRKSKRQEGTLRFFPLT